MKQYFWNLFIALDQLANTIVGGDPDETISSRCGKRVKITPCYWLCRALHLLDKEHCEESIEKGEGDRAVWQ